MSVSSNVLLLLLLFAICDNTNKKNIEYNLIENYLIENNLIENNLKYL